MNKWRIFTLLLMTMTASVCLAGGDVSKKVKFMSGDNGTVYFVVPQKMAKASDCKALKNLSYDVSYLNSEDSVSFLCTIVTRTFQKFTEATFSAKGLPEIRADVKVIYIEPKGKKYDNRLRLRISYEDFKKLYSHSAPYVVDFGSGFRFGFKEKAWSKECLFMTNVFIMIDSSK